MTSSSLYQVVNLKGKGLGCVASKNIEKGALILSENPQIRGRISEELKDETKWIKTLVQSFNRMNKADQIDYLALHSKYDDIQTLQPDFKGGEISEGIFVFAPSSKRWTKLLSLEFLI